MKNEPSAARPRRSARRVLVGAGIAVFVLLAAEIGFRAAGIDPGRPGGRRPPLPPSYLRLSPDPVLRWELIPGFDEVVDGTRISVNGSGLRGPEVGAEKGDRIRIAVLGSSVHPGIPENQTYARRLEQKLKGVEPRFEVLDMGVDGYDPLQGVAALEQKGASLQPDVVVLCFRLTDIAVNRADLSGLVLRARKGGLLGGLRVWRWIRKALTSPRGRAEAARRLSPGADPYGPLYPPAPSDIILEAQFKRIADSQSYYETASGEGAGRAVTESPGRLWLNKYADLKAIGRVRFALAKLETLAHSRGFRVLVAVVPFFYEVDGRYLEEPAHRILRHEADLNKFSFRDLRVRFQRSGFDAVGVDGVELSPFGHAVLAEGLFRALGRAYYPELIGGADADGEEPAPR